MMLADLHLREQDLPAAKRLFERSLKLAPENSEIKLFCFERLANVNSWGADESILGWVTILLVHSLKLKAKLQVYKGLQFFGDMFLIQGDKDTAMSLFTVALMGFTYMDIHQSKAECMRRLGDIFHEYSDMLKARELWETARLLFEQSSQAKEVQCVDERLACVGSDVLEHYQENIGHLVGHNVPSQNPSSTKDEEQVNLGDVLVNK
jgi:tetratricopeptide (TPR) repeat protein